MKELDLRSIAIQNIQARSYADLARAVLNVPPKAGFALDQMRRRLSLLEKLDRADAEMSSVMIEDAEAAELKSAVAAMPWSVLDPQIVAFCDHVNGL